VELQLAGHLFAVTYRVEGTGCGPRWVNLNGADLPFTRGANPYRPGAAEIPMAAVQERLTGDTNRLTIYVG